MMIHENNSIAYPIFADISAGEVFKRGSAYYMALAIKSGCKYNAVNLESGEPWDFYPHEEVQRCKHAVLNFEN